MKNSYEGNQNPEEIRSEYVSMDKDYSWHPFTQMKDWVEEDPVMIEKGEGAYLWDFNGNKYLDANSSIWTNLHGHNHAGLNSAIQSQLNQFSHVSYLGLGHGPGSQLAQDLVDSCKTTDKNQGLKKVFFSDDGSTAIETALKISHTSAQRLKGKRNPKYLSLNNSYHGDSVGAVSLGQVESFHNNFRSLLFPVDKVMNPYCYRCPFNKASYEPGIPAHESKKCQWECIGELEKAFASKKRSDNESYAGLILEPGIQGVAGMVVQPDGWLEKATSIAKENDTWLIYDEVMTGFGRTGPTYAYQIDNIPPDILCLAKGITGGYLPLAATLTTEEQFSAFLGDYSDFKTFFHGHSYTANALGCAAAIKNLNLLKTESDAAKRKKQAKWLRNALSPLWKLPNVGDIRQLGTIAGIELVKDKKSKLPFHWSERVGVKVCEQLKSWGIITRPIGNVIVVMPPYCLTQREYDLISSGLIESISRVSV